MHPFPKLTNPSSKVGNERIMYTWLVDHVVKYLHFQVEIYYTLNTYSVSGACFREKCKHNNLREHYISIHKQSGMYSSEPNN